MRGLLGGCFSCRNFSGCQGGNGFCRVSGAILVPTWGLGRGCPYWTAQGAERPEDTSTGSAPGR